MSMAPRIPTVYRFYDAAGVLLYVGSTWRPHARWRQHQGKPWFPEVATARIEQFPDVESMRAAEREAICTEHPRHNVIGRRRPVDLEELARQREAKEQRKAEEAARVQEQLEPLRRLTAERAEIRRFLREEWPRAVREALAEGHSASEIAKLAGVSATRVYQIGRGE